MLLRQLSYLATSWQVERERDEVLLRFLNTDREHVHSTTPMIKNWPLV